MTGIAVLCAACGSATAGELYISLNNPNIDIGLAGNTFLDDDVIKTDEAGSVSSLFFSAASDINAFHVRPDGKYIVSGLFNFSVGGSAFEDDDLALYDPMTDTATFLVDGSGFFDSTAEDFDAITQDNSGNYLFSTLADASVAGNAFTDGDIMMWDGVAATVSLFASAASIFDDGAGDISGLHFMSDGSLLITAIADEMVSGVQFREGDIFRWNPTLDTASLFFNRDVIDTMGQSSIPELDAIYWQIPAPGAGVLACAGLAFGGVRRRRA
jgi:hypothetical protein